MMVTETIITGFLKDVVVGLSAIFLCWVGAILIASSKLVWSNWTTFMDWKKQDKEIRLRMAIWLAIPMLMSGLLWMRGVAIWHYVAVYGIPLFSLVQMLVYMPIVLLSLAMILWWVCNRSFDQDEADKIWAILVSSGGGIGAVSTTLSYIF